MGLREHPHDVAAGFPQRKQRKRDGSHNVFHDLPSEVTHQHFCGILLVTQASPIQGERWVPPDKDHWGHIGGWLPDGASGGHACMLFLVLTMLL